jgi:hypothetical protein
MKRFPLLSLTIAVAGFSLLTSCEPSTNKADLDRLFSPAMLPYVKNSKLIQVSSADSTGGNNDRISIRPDSAATILDVTGPGVITRIWFTVDSRDPYFLRRIVIRMFWDDEAEPSVEVPLGDFFGTGFEYKPYISQYLGMTSGGYVCYFPMPFEKSARIQIVNETGQEVYAFYYQVDYQSLEGYLDRNVAYFHAYWHRDIRTNYDSNYTILRTTGRGHVVGVNLNIQSYNKSLSFLEGNEMVFVDGEVKAAIVGTGTEDFFSGGWYFQNGEFSGPYNGLLLKNDSLGRIAAYRLYTTEPIPFKKSINFTIEHGPGNTEVADYSSTVYFYLLEPHKPYQKLPKSGMRIPLKVVTPTNLMEAENLAFNLGKIRSTVEDVSRYGPDWSGGRQLLILTDSASSFSLLLKNLFESGYTIDLYYSKGPDYGNVMIMYNGKEAGRIEGYSPNIQAGGKITIRNVQPKYGRVELKFRIDGKTRPSRGYHTGIDGIYITPKRSFIPDWYVLGPFANPRITESRRLGLDSVYLPEQMIDTNQAYFGVNKKPIHWQYVKTPENGYVTLWDKVSPNELVVAYALTYVWSDKEKDVLLLIGSDDGAKVFFNDREIYRFMGVRIAEPDQASIPIHVMKGWNKLLLKIENNFGGYAFYARFMDPESTLFASAKQKTPPPAWNTGK